MWQPQTGPLGIYLLLGLIADESSYLTSVKRVFLQGFELMLLSLGDPSERVVSAVHQVFIPAFAAWTTELGTLQTSLIPSLLARIEKLLMVINSFVYMQYSTFMCVYQPTDLGAMDVMNCSITIIPLLLVPTLCTSLSLCSKENIVWMSTSYMCSCRPCSLSSLLCSLWCFRMHLSLAEPNSTETYLQ